MNWIENESLGREIRGFKRGVGTIAQRGREALMPVIWGMLAEEVVVVAIAEEFIELLDCANAPPDKSGMNTERTK